MGQIALEGMEFFAFHGYYDEEQRIGNKYGIDLFINTDLQRAAESDDLDETVNYEVLYNLVLEEMKVPARLLEHLGHRIIDKVYDRFTFVQSVKINVYKFNPPLGGICKWAKVSLEESR
ncbi:dihydroneopterin aldolase [Pontibacter silvestris]|uniref:7,8-dihydroneopterin aldolase n=1 Tax=Pontibacter silvestris TaxID=2305183 RepID=A0ABW4X384_9BACT|nr:dihydroneopterin aldolase [Pontibacter silvestris]MCC9137902.1 dihydroneopterin aldolase [Pontibacter silvestris]